jgi:hypothetical protein
VASYPRSSRVARMAIAAASVGGKINILKEKIIL